MPDRPLHLDEWGDSVYQHPIKGCVFKHGDDYLDCFAQDVGRGGHPDDEMIYIGVEEYRARNELGAWLTKVHPNEKHRLINHLFTEAVFPLNFEGETPESKAVLGRIDMTQSVMDAGGACTICSAPNDLDSGVNHAVGCEYMSWLMYQITQRILDADGEPTLADVVEAAQQQIDRMA